MYIRQCGRGRADLYSFGSLGREPHSGHLTLSKAPFGVVIRAISLLSSTVCTVCRISALKGWSCFWHRRSLRIGLSISGMIPLAVAPCCSHSMHRTTEKVNSRKLIYRMVHKTWSHRATARGLFPRPADSRLRVGRSLILRPYAAGASTPPSCLSIAARPLGRLSTAA